MTVWSAYRHIPIWQLRDLICNQNQNENDRIRGIGILIVIFIWARAPPQFERLLSSTARCHINLAREHLDERPMLLDRNRLALPYRFDGKHPHRLGRRANPDTSIESDCTRERANVDEFIWGKLSVILYGEINSSGEGRGSRKNYRHCKCTVWCRVAPPLVKAA